MKLGVAIVVLFVGFDGDEEAGRMGGDIIVGEVAGRSISSSSDGGLECAMCSSGLASVCGIGSVDRMDRGRARFGATRCDEI